jgi:hypothetical protein
MLRHSVVPIFIVAITLIFSGFVMDSNESFEGEEIRYNPEVEVVEGPDLLVARSAVSAKVADMCGSNDTGGTLAGTFINGDTPECCAGSGACCTCSGCSAGPQECECPEAILE